MSSASDELNPDGTENENVPEYNNQKVLDYIKRTISKCPKLSRFDYSIPK